MIRTAVAIDSGCFGMMESASMWKLLKFTTALKQLDWLLVDFEAH